MKFQYPNPQRPRTDLRYEALLEQSPILRDLLLPSERGSAAHFVVVGDLPLSVEDLDAALNMNEVEGTLDAQEIQAIVWPELDTHEGAWSLQGFEWHFQAEEKELRVKLERARKAKRKRVLRLAGAYLLSPHGEIPRKDALLMAFSKGKLHFSDLTSYLAAAADLDESGAELVSKTAGEVRGVLDTQSRAVDAGSSEVLGSVFNEHDFRWFCGMLGMKPEQLVQTPVVVAERTLMGHSFEEQDARQVYSYDRQRSGTSIPFSLETQLFTAGAVYSLPAFFTAVFLGIENPLSLPLMYSTVGALSGGMGLAIASRLGFAPLSSLARHLAVSGKKSTFTEGYLKAYEEIRERIEELKKVPMGRMKVLFLRMWIQNKVGTAPMDEDTLLGLYHRLQALWPHREAFRAFFEHHGESYFDSTPFEDILNDFEHWPKE